MMQNQTSPVVVQPSNVGRNKRYHLQWGVCLGIFIVILAVCMVALKIVIHTMVHWFLPFYTPVFWGNAMFFIAGALTIAGGCNNSHCIVISAMVMCILSVIFGGLGIIIESGTNASRFQFCGIHIFSAPCSPTSVRIYWMNVALVVAAVVESILAIIASSMACSTSCDCCNKRENNGTVHYSPANHNTGLGPPGLPGYAGNNAVPTGVTGGYPPPGGGGGQAAFNMAPPPKANINDSFQPPPPYALHNPPPFNPGYSGHPT